MMQICDNHIHFDFNVTNSTNFQSLEVVDRGSETQFQVAENSNLLAWDGLRSVADCVYID